MGKTDTEPNKVEFHKSELQKCKKVSTTELFRKRIASTLFKLFRSLTNSTLS